MKKRTLISKIPTFGAIRLFDQSPNKVKIPGIEKQEIVLCSEEFDNKTTYVRKKEFNQNSKKYDFIPYVDCDYVE
jgi:hypothetical protein